MSMQHKARMLYLEGRGKLSKAEKSELEQLHTMFGKTQPKMVEKSPKVESKKVNEM